MHIYDVTTAADVSLVAATAKTILSIINGSTRRSRVLEIQLGGFSIVQTDTPMLIELVRFTTDGTGTSVTPVARDTGNPASIATAKYGYSVEPTTATVLWTTRLSPIGGTLVIPISPDRFPVNPISNLIALRLTCAQAQSGVRGALCFEE
jgi:hypothetical protein